MLIVDSKIRIPQSEFELTFVRSSGPGGQNVNKVNTKAVLRWPVLASPSLPEAVRARFVASYASRITTEGELIITSQRFREQNRNSQDCLEKLRTMLAAVAKPPKTRRRTRPSRGSIERRLEHKRDQGQKKESRRPPKSD